MSTSICLPVHILDAHITPHAREVLMPQTILKDSRIAYWADYARQKHEENLRIHKMILAQMH